MINYLLSDCYRLCRTRNLYVISGVCFALIAAAAFTLAAFANSGKYFPYGTTDFYYSNVLGMIVFVIIVGYLFALMLTSHNREIIGQSISFGTSRKTIFWSKWLLSLAAFSLMCLIAGTLMIILGETLLDTNGFSKTMIVIAIVNAAPIILAGFSFSYVASILNLRETYNFLLIILIFGFSGYIFSRLFSFNEALRQVTNYFPDNLLNKNLDNYLNASNQLDITYWLVGLGMTIIVLAFGYYHFKKQDI